MDFDVAARKDIDVPSGMRPRSDQFRTGTVRSATELMSLLEASLMQLTSLVFCAGRSMPVRKASIMMVIRSSITMNEFLVRVLSPSCPSCGFEMDSLSVMQQLFELIEISVGIRIQQFDSGRK